MDIARKLRDYATLDRRRRDSGLSPRDLARWQQLKRQLGQHFSPGLSDVQADRRESLRVPTRLRVTFASDGALADSLITTFSRKGVFVATDHPVAIGEQIEIQIEVARPARSIRARAEVVTHGLGPRLDPRRGMGLRFLEGDAETEKQLDDLYERLLR